MIVRFWIIVIQTLLRLRYRIRLVGLKAVAARGRSGILFLPNHPAMIDPIIMMAYLTGRFRAQALADSDQVDKFFVRHLARHFPVRKIPDVAKVGAAAKGDIDRALDDLVADLAAGRNVLIYPSGRIYRHRHEDLGGASGVAAILQRLPGVRVVLVRTRGLWGSGFSWARGHAPDLGGTLRRGLLGLFSSALFFAPRRKITIEFVEAGELPRDNPAALRRHLEAFYNADAPPNTYVPYSMWQGFRPRQLPEPPRAGVSGDLSAVSDEVRRRAGDYLRQLAGRETLDDAQTLGADLGLDSLARADLLVWLEKEFGFAADNVDLLQTVGDVYLAAAKLAEPALQQPLQPVPAGWFNSEVPDPFIPPVSTVVEAFLHHVRRTPNRVIIADQSAGGRTFRDVLTAAAVLRGHIRPLEGDRVGILLPASVGADVVYMAVLLAGKTPVMVNWTVGPRNMQHGLDLAGVKHVLTSRLLIDRLSQRGTDFAGLADRLVFLEDVRGRITLRQKLAAALAARFAPGSLAPAKIPDVIAILFTSGSESLPKAVPLTNANVLANLRDVLQRIRVHRTDRLVGFLPPFHSFGLATGILFPFCANLPVVHHTDPTQGAFLARLIEAYKGTMVLGTPTFLAAILAAASPQQLASMRMAVTGAEKCGPKVYEAFARQCPSARVVEGYGITECSPIVSFSDYDRPVPGTIGRPMPSIEWVLLHPETGQPVPVGQAGMLLVRGPSIFGGYLGDAPDPFVEHDGKKWYRTGDLVIADADGCLTFAGRLKRFVKLGGEMISLPAIEAVLAEAWAKPSDEGPVVAVESTPSDPPEIVLFTTLPLTRQEVNDRLRSAGLSGLHSIRHVVKLDSLPVLGTGKTDYRALKELFKTMGKLS